MRPALRLLALAFVLAACASTQHAPELLVVGSDLDNPPFAGVDEGGRAIGREVEMMEHLCRETGRELVWKRMPFADLIGAVECGEIDAACATIGITPERAECVRFTRPYFVTSIALVARRGAFAGFTLDSLEGKRVAASRGTTSERALALRAPCAIAVLERKNDVTIAQRLEAGEIDAAAMDGPAARALVDASGGALELLPVALEHERYAIALPREYVQFGNDLDDLLDEMERSGALRALDAKFGLESSSGAESPRRVR